MPDMTINQVRYIGVSDNGDLVVTLIHKETSECKTIHVLHYKDVTVTGPDTIVVSDREE